jgi:hypothetical protein
MTVAKSKIVRPYAPDYVGATTLPYLAWACQQKIEAIACERNLDKSAAIKAGPWPCLR